jgi:hypothetical protein
MRAVTTAVLVLALALFLQACELFYLEPVGCASERVPKFLTVNQQITRNDVIAEMGEPVETISSEDGYRVDIYDAGSDCVGLVLLVPYVVYDHSSLTVDYHSDGSFLTARVWPDTEISEDFVEIHKRRVKLGEECRMPFSEAIQLDAATQYDRGFSCPTMRSDPQTALLPRQWMCLSAHQGDQNAQYVLGKYYRQGSNLVLQDPIEAYKWLSLAAKDGDATTKRLRDVFARQLTPEQIAEAERLVAEWEPNPAECEIETAATTH